MTDYVVESGFTRNDITLFSGDTLTVANGGTAVNTTVLGSATITVDSGGGVSGTNVSSGGVLTVDGEVSETTVSAGGDVEVAAGSFTGHTVLLAGGVQRVAGFASNTLVTSGATQTLLNGGRAAITFINSGGREIVSSGGSTDHSDVRDGGRQTVSFGGIAVAGAVDSGGLVVVSSGGTASLTRVSSGGTQIIAGGTASFTIVDSGGQETVASGGTSSDTVLSGSIAEEFVQSGGTASHTTAISGGFIDVFGGLCVDAVIGDGGLADVMGTMTSTTVGSGGNFIMIGGTDSATLISGGSETVEPGALCIDPTIEGGSLDLTSGSLLSGGVTFAGTNPIALSTMNFDGDPATIVNNTISGFTQSGDVIDLTALVFSGNTSVGFDPLTDMLTVTEGGNSATIQLDSETYTGITWSATQDAGTGTAVTAIPCFCRGTLILTEGGERAVEELAIGDRVVTVSGEARPIRWIGRRDYDGRFVGENRAVLPIRIAAGALADGVPRRDLLVSPEHALYLDGALVPALLLANGSTIRQVANVDRLEYFHIELEAHDVILAEGAPAETFVDCDNRGMFQNGGEYARLYPDEMRPHWQFCAPRIDPESPQLAATRAALLARAEALGMVGLDPDLHLVADGEIVRPQSTAERLYRFVLPAGVGSVAIVSRHAVPAQTQASAIDRRVLGVAVERITLRSSGLHTEIGHDCPALKDGFYPAEASHRWTNGRAQLPPALLDAFTGAVTIELRLAETVLRYPMADTSSRTARPDDHLAADRISDAFFINLDRRGDRRQRFLGWNNHKGIDLCRFEAVDGAALMMPDLLRSRIVQDAGLAFTGGALGNAVSHRELWQLCIDRGRPIMVFEDDALLPDDIAEWTRPILSEVENRCDILYFGYNRDAPLSIGDGVEWCNVGFDGVNPDFDRRRQRGRAGGRMPSAGVFDARLVWGTLAYAIAPCGAQRLLDHCFPLVEGLPVQLYGTGQVVRAVAIDGVINCMVQRALVKARAVFPPLVTSPNDAADSDIVRR